MTEKSPADQRCRIGRCRTPLPALHLEAGTAGLLAWTAAGQYPRTLPSLSLALRHGLRLLPPSEEVTVCFGRPDLEVLLVKSFFHIVVMNHVFWFVLVFGCLILLCITLRMLKNEKKYNCYCFKPLER